MPDPKQKKTLPNLGNKNASMGMDGKMTIISDKMKKNYKPTPEKKPMKYIDSKTGKDVEKYPAAPQMGHSPAEMSSYAQQERKHLMQDMPVVKDATGGRSWMSKHSKSAFHMGHSPAEMGHDSPAKHKGSAHGAKHSEEVGHQGTNIHSHTGGKQKKREDQMAAAKKRKKVKATIKAGKAIARSM